MENNFNDKLRKLLNEINVDITENQISKFYEYMNLLLEWNEKINLTRPARSPWRGRTPS